MLNQLQKHLKFVFSYFFRAGRPSRKNAPNMTSQSHSGTLPGSLRGGEIDPLSAPGGPQAANNEFLGTPGPLQDGSGEPLEAESAPKGCPEPSREPFRSHLASIWDPPGHHFPRFPAICSVVFLVLLIVFSRAPIPWGLASRISWVGGCPR